MAMLLNDAVKLGVLSGLMIAVMESALKELRWNTFQVWTGRNRGRIMEACRQEASSDLNEEESSGSDGQTPLPSDDSEGSASRPPRPILEDYRELCPRFALFKAEEAARNSELSKMVQATFYTILLNDTVELSIVRGFIAVDLKASLEGLRWSPFESWTHVNRRGLLEAQLCQRTPPGGAPEFANGCEASLGSNNPSPPSSDDE
ncbi:hypothetical protein Cgig2_025544 [Carnegiea gigantea]|uniref:Uncharacterized protein n=1 Tax=Carnegiea gigantea TaxID=171969 RepID=A0A9Q1KBT4_9CARY|nr:hypothetical protein Cgig2_025544 [Carnegiea gigantea]